MRRKTNLYHRLWYAKRNKKIYKTYVVIIFVLIILFFLFTYIEKRIRIGINQISEYRVKSIVSRVVANAVGENFPENIDYDDIVTIYRDENGIVTSVQTDIAKLNRIFANVSSSVQTQLSELSDEKISIPLGTVLGQTIFAARGPKINIKIIPIGSVETDFKSEFSSAGINQTRHRIYIVFKVEMGVAIPFVEKKTIVTTSMPVAETVIVGDVPNYYLNFE
ncbi:sporulation protein YunB [Acetivibrio clariflavus]|uniref:sporulation protein YunB n=1 Tax=Acetivibrio clariflavus TaxID=288965 RepID=UPI0004845151|nr:sporulation protein YunB [Acetivibrio clariflavus]